MDSIFLGCLALSLAVEVPILVAVVRLVQRSRPPPWPRVVGTGVLATATTLPYLWFLVPAFVHTPLYYWCVGEGLVIAVEAGIIAFVLQLPIRHSLLASALCNVASLGVGWATLTLFLVD